MKVVHITPHLGGGAGAVIIAWLLHDKHNQHQIITLDFANEQAANTLVHGGIECVSQPAYHIIDDMVSLGDIVIVHFWNHPLLYKFLITHTLPPSRMVFWMHVSGVSAPNIITEKAIAFPDEFVFTTPISSLYAGGGQMSIASTSGIQRYLGLPKTAHEGFVVGYVGTVDYAKMHPDYIRVHSQIDADRFLIVGGNDERRISAEADERFEFTGKVIDVRPYLAQMDVLGYMLNEKHFGTCEQAMQEAMAVGIPIVALDNPCECSLIQDGTTGLIAHTEEEYIRLVMRLKTDKALYSRISENGKRYAEKFFSLEYMIEQWGEVFQSMMEEPKKLHVWKKDKADMDSFDVFCESIGKEAADVFASGDTASIKELLADSCWQSDSKGTPKQYYAFLGGERLAEICKLYEECKEY